MTEYAIPLEDLIPGEGHSNGVKEFSPLIVSPNSAHVDPVRGVFITSRGEEIQLSDRPVSALIYERLQNEGKPKIPDIEVTILGRKAKEPHPGHPGYLARLAEWESESQLAVLRYLFTVGTKGTPPPEFVEEQRPFFPTATDLDMKYLWVASRLPDEDMALFTEAVMGKSLVTAKGLEESADSFRGES
jgi:hypothetical protein